MKFKNKIIAFIGIIALLGLSGCARYRGRPLNRLAVDVLPNSKEQFIAFDYQVFDKSDCLTYLDRDVICKGYQPVQIAFVNNSKRSFGISNESFSFICVPSEEVARTVHTSTVKRVVGYGVAGLFIWPLLIPAVVDGVGSSEANQQLDTDFAQKSLRHQTVKPYAMTNSLVFALTSDFDENFTLTVTDKETREHFVLTPDQPRLNLK